MDFYQTTRRHILGDNTAQNIGTYDMNIPDHWSLLVTPGA
jgi:hypothetical protein